MVEFVSFSGDFSPVEKFYFVAMTFNLCCTLYTIKLLKCEAKLQFFYFYNDYFCRVLRLYRFFPSVAHSFVLGIVMPLLSSCSFIGDLTCFVCGDLSPFVFFSLWCVILVLYVFIWNFVQLQFHLYIYHNPASWYTVVNGCFRNHIKLNLSTTFKPKF